MAHGSARAALAGLSASERIALANESVTTSLATMRFLDPDLITVTTSQSGDFYSVEVSYDAARSPLFAASLVPLPAGRIERAAVVKLASI
jgi:hypothetical protein